LSSPRVRLGLLIAGILVLLAGSYWYYNHQTYGRFQQSTDNAYIAADSVIISPKIAGYVERVLVTENQTVASGDALVQLDVRDYRAQTNQVEAQIAASLAGADTVRAQQQEQDAAIAQARAQLAAASAQAGLAAEQVVRYRPLAASGAEPRERLDQLEAQAREAQAQVAAARAALTAAQRRQNTLSEQIDQANSQANAARAQLEAARLNLSSTTLQASISGRVGDLTVRPGQFVQPGQRLMSLVPTDRLYVTANFKETQLGLVRPGQPVTLEIDALPDLELSGRVQSIAPGPGQNSRSYLRKTRRVISPRSFSASRCAYPFRLRPRSCVCWCRACLLSRVSIRAPLETNSIRSATRPETDRWQAPLQRFRRRSKRPMLRPGSP
jgi:membrane fusion protein (multidrug efflux system)